MYPIHDIVLVLKEKPFDSWEEEYKQDVITHGRPTHQVDITILNDKSKGGNRKFHHSKYDDWYWLCSSSYLMKLFCWPCLLFCKRASCWTKDGFDDLKNMHRSLQIHGDSFEHLKCAVILRNYLKNVKETDNLSEQSKLYKAEHNETVRLNRLLMHTVINAVIYLGKQGLLFSNSSRNENTSVCPNFEELLNLLLSKEPLEVRNQFKKNEDFFTSDSNIILNELADCISERLDETVRSEIETSVFFSIQLDDSLDLLRKSSCSVIARYVTSDAQLVERFLRFHYINMKRTSETLFELLQQDSTVLEHQKKLVGLSCGGAVFPLKNVNKLWKKCKLVVPNAMLVFSLAHRLNDELELSLRSIKSCRTFFANLGSLSSFFCNSVKKTYAVGHRKISVAQWSSNSNLLKAIVRDWIPMKELLKFIKNSHDSDNTSVFNAKMLLKNMSSFKFTFLSVVFNDVFASTGSLCALLQERSPEIRHCDYQISQAKAGISQRKNVDSFNALYFKAIKLTDPIPLCKSEGAKYSLDDLRSKCEVLFYEILDLIVSELDVRFQDYDKLKFVALTDTSKFEVYNREFPQYALDDLKKSFGEFFVKPIRLRSELCLLYADRKYVNQNVQEVLKLLKDDVDIFPETYRLFSLVLTIPTIFIPAEKNFSCLKRIKASARGTLSEESPSSLANISIQKDLLSELSLKTSFYDEIINKYAALNDRKIDLIPLV